MKKIFILSVVTVIALNAAEFEYGRGTFTLEGGFVGLNGKISTDVNTYSTLERHKNILSSKWYYRYNFTWIDSNYATQAQNTVNTLTSTVNLPSIDYKLQGLDANAVLGRDIINKDDGDTYLGLGLLVGISVPYIKSDNSSSTSPTTTILKNSKTKFTTYKVGLNISASKQITHKLSMYLYGSYAYQNANLKNSSINLDTSSNGIFEEIDVGFRYTPLSFKKKIWFLELNPKLYFTAGYRYSYWQVKDVSINVSGVGASWGDSNLDMKNSIAYIGIGYSF